MQEKIINMIDLWKKQREINFQMADISTKIESEIEILKRRIAELESREQQ